MSNDYARFSNMTILAKDASVTVPHGTFMCTQQRGFIHSAVQRATYDVTVWVNSDIPNWGVVRYVFLLNGSPYSEFWLQSYGS